MLVLTTLFGRPAAGADYCIAPNGNDSNNGTVSSPWMTLTKAISVARGGDTIYVRGGEYAEGEIWIRPDLGTGPGKMLTIRSYPGETPVFSNGSRGLIIDISYVRIQGLNFTNGKDLGSLVEVSHHEYVGNSFSGSGYAWDAISVAGSNMLLDGNVISLLGNSQGTQGHGIYVHAGSNNVIRNNRISGMAGYGIHIFDQRRSGDPPGYTRLISDVVVEGNVIWGSQERAGIIVAAYDQAKAQNVMIRNNVIYHHAGNGINVQYDVSDIKVYNNTIYDINADAIDWNGDAGIYVGEGADNVQLVNNLISIKNSGWHVVVPEGANIAVDHNLYWPSPLRLDGISDVHGLLGDPQFNDADNNDFSLTPTSPAIDAGIDVGLPYAGTAPDLGAYEFGLAVPVELANFSYSVNRGNVILAWETPSYPRDLRCNTMDRNMALNTRMPITTQIHSVIMCRS